MKKAKSKMQLIKMLGAGVVLAGAVALNGTAAKAANDVAINETNFPDAIFRNYVWENFDQDKNGSLNETEIGNVTKIDVSGTRLEGKKTDDGIDFSGYISNGVKSVKGIELFPNLKTLECSCNDITELDVSKNTALEYLGCSHNKITLLDLYSNPNLYYLSCAYNDIHFIDLKKCPKLELTQNEGRVALFDPYLDDGYFPGKYYVIKGVNGEVRYYLSSDAYIGTSEDAFVDVAIDEFFPDPAFNKYVKDHCDWNGDGWLSSFERCNTKIIDCSGSGIKSLEGLNYFPYLTILKCDHNQINSLDIFALPALEELYCNDNPLRTLDITEDDENEESIWNECLRTVVCHNCELRELIISSRIVLEDAYEFGTVSVDQNTLTFSYEGVILKIDKGVKLIPSQGFGRNPDSIAISKKSIILEKGKPQKLEVIMVPDYAVPDFEWSSDNTKVATVDENGNVTFKGVGTAKITVESANELTATCEVTCLVENSVSNPFADIASDNWAFASMKDMLDKKIMVGTGELGGKIVSGCDNVLTRAQFARILYSMENEPAVEYSDTFSDVSKGMWYTNAIMWANANKLIVGKGSYFDIDAPATREQIATILKRYAEFKGLDVSVAEGIDEKIAGFSDKGSISSWAEDGLKWALSHEILFGKSKSVLDPNGEATRAECAAMVSRFLNNIH